MLERIAQVKLSSNFHFTGFLKGEDVDRIWAMSNVYVMPSVSEPFGIAPLEAIQAGVPVILSKQAGVSEVMPHAIKVDFWNSEALAEAICNLLRFKSLANTLKKNGTEQIKNITWDKAAKKLTTLYYELSTKHEKGEKSDLLLSGSPTQKASHPAVL
jgi:glycosyltransferase involved in cell wall biosynthesis